MGYPCESPPTLEQGSAHKPVIVGVSHDLRGESGIRYHDLYLGGKALVEKENVGLDLTKSDLCPSFVEDLTAKGMGLRVVDSHTVLKILSAFKPVNLRKKSSLIFLENYPVPPEHKVMVPKRNQTIFDAPNGYPTSVRVFPDPILFMVGLKSSWEHGQQRPAIIVGRQ
ncbi:hypothetical protein Tco_1471665, partial [Tanacetum coccineum]